MAKVKLEYTPRLCKLINPDNNVSVRECNAKQCTEIISPEHSCNICEYAEIGDRALLIKEAKTVSYISNNNNWTLIIDDMCIDSSDVITIDKLTIDDEIIIDN